MIPFPNKKYKIIYADPPWEYDVDYRKNAAKQKYQTQHNLEIGKLPIHEIRDNPCILLCWATFPKLKECLELISLWGFEYKTCFFVWVKTSNYTNNQYNYLGMGTYTRQNAEVCLLATYGSGASKLVRKKNPMRNIIYSPVREHSRKPPEIRDKIVKLFGDIPRIELFARTKVHGWDVWGNDEKLESQPLEAFK